MLRCPNCNKKLEWLPKGKHTCLCGEIIKTDGKDLEAIAISITDLPFKGNFQGAFKIQPALAIIPIISALVIFSLNVYYYITIMQFEANLMFKLFSIDPESYKQSILLFIVAAIIVVWFMRIYFRKIKN